MASKRRNVKKGKKGKKGKKTRGRLRKINLDLFGLLTFTRFYGKEWEEFMYAGDKKNKSKKGGIPKKKKKDKKPQPVPKLPMFPPVKEPTKKGKSTPLPENMKVVKPVILPMGTTGYKHKTTRKDRDLTEGGSVRDVLCGPTFPLPPRPLPHGGVYGDAKCPSCLSEDHLLKTNYGMLHKKMRKLINNQFEKARYILQYLIDHANMAMDYYRKHMQSVLDELNPILDGLDESEWNDHNEVKKLRDQWKQLRQDLDELKKELKKLRQNRDEEIRKTLEAKTREVDEAEARLHALEKELHEALNELNEWKMDSKGKLQGPADEIARRLAYLRAVQQSIIRERDDLRALLSWETKIATQKTVEEMERIIAEDIDHVLQYMNPAWFRLVLENRKLLGELENLNAENELLGLEVDALQRQCGKMEAQKRHIERIKTWRIRPPNLPGLVDRLKTSDKLQIQLQLVTNLIHE